MDLEQTFRSFGLSYHYDHLTTAIKHFGPLEDKRVFEIGGCLPREIVCERLGARSWIGLDKSDYWTESGDDNPSRLSQATSIPLAGFSLEDADYACLEGDVLDLPPTFMGQFDLVFSTSAFEHVSDIRRTVQTASRLLKSGGGLFAVAMPIWPSSRGHHLPPIPYQDEVFSFTNPPIPDWAHLYMEPAEMAANLSLWLPGEVVDRIVYMCFDSPHINRAFVEDYEDSLSSASFSERHIISVPDRSVPGDIRARIEARQGKCQLEQYGICLVARR